MTEYRVDEDGVKILECEHVARNDNVYSVLLWVGENTRMAICRLCSTVALGTITSQRMKEAIRESVRVADE